MNKKKKKKYKVVNEKVEKKMYLMKPLNYF